MFRIIRTRTLAELRDAAVAGEIDAAEAEKWHGMYREEVGRADAAEERVEKLLSELGQAHADRIAAEAGRTKDAARLKKETESALAGIAAEVVRLKEAAADPETGTEVQRRIALPVLRTLLERAELAALSEGCHLDPFMQLAAVLLAPPAVEGEEAT